MYTLETSNLGVIVKKRTSSIQLSTLYKGDQLLDKNYFKIMWFTLAFHKMEKPWLVNYQGLLWI